MNDFKYISKLEKTETCPICKIGCIELDAKVWWLDKYKYKCSMCGRLFRRERK